MHKTNYRICEWNTRQVKEPASIRAYLETLSKDYKTLYYSEYII